MVRLWSPDGDADHLIAASKGKDGTGTHDAKESTDAGRSWKPIGIEKVPAPANGPITVKGITLTPGLFGLTRKAQDGT